MTMMTKEILGKLFGNRGYISEALSELLFQNGIQLIIRVRKKMKKQTLSDVDATLLRKRGLVESINEKYYN